METNENTKNQKKVAIPIVAIIVIIIAVIVGYFVLLRIQARQVEKIIETAISQLKDGNLNSTKELLKNEEGSKDNAELLAILENIESNPDNGNVENIFFKHLQYKIVKSEANFKKAKVTVEVTNKDLGKAFSNYVKEAAKLAFRSAFSNEYTDKDIDNKLLEYLEHEINSEELETVTNTITIEAEKENGKWRLTTDGRTIADALLPGLIERVESLQKSFEELEGNKTEETQSGEGTDNNNQENNTNNPDNSINNSANNNVNEGNTTVQGNNVEGGNTSIL